MTKVVLMTIICFSLVLSNAVFAITPGEIPTSGDLGIKKTLQDETAGGVKGVIQTIVKWVYIIFFIIAVLFIIFAAFTYLTAQGDPEKVKTATNQIIYAAVAIVVALVAVSIDLIIKNFLISGGKGGGGGTQYWPSQSGSVRLYPFQEGGRQPSPPGQPSSVNNL